jgi:lipoprotein-anchoring transpeptidase ErfK/SrfK
VRRTVRYVLGVCGVATLAMTGAVATSAASVTTAPRVASISPAAGEVVGVAMPITVEFTGAVPNRGAAQRDIAISAPTVPAGDFVWLDDHVVQWTPSEFFPAHAPITVTAGGAKTSYETGAAVVGVADIDAHTFTVSIDDQVVRDMPASMGKPKFPTPVGSFTALEKQRNVTFDSRTIGIPLSSSEGYLIKGEYAVRVTWGGVYVHSAPWSVGSQGYANVSHGCINLSPDNAAWYFDMVSVGDPIIVRA